MLRAARSCSTFPGAALVLPRPPLGIGLWPIGFQPSGPPTTFKTTATTGSGCVPANGAMPSVGRGAIDVLIAGAQAHALTAVASSVVRIRADSGRRGGLLPSGWAGGGRRRAASGRLRHEVGGGLRRAPGVSSVPRPGVLGTGATDGMPYSGDNYILYRIQTSWTDHSQVRGRPRKTTPNANRRTCPGSPGGAGPSAVRLTLIVASPRVFSPELPVLVATKRGASLVVIFLLHAQSGLGRAARRQIQQGPRSR